MPDESEREQVAGLHQLDGVIDDAFAGAVLLTRSAHLASAVARLAVPGHVARAGFGRKAVAGGRRPGWWIAFHSRIEIDVARGVRADRQTTAGCGKPHIPRGPCMLVRRGLRRWSRTRERLSGKRRRSRLLIARSGPRRGVGFAWVLQSLAGMPVGRRWAGQPRCGKLLIGAGIDYSTSVIRPGRASRVYGSVRFTGAGVERRLTAWMASSVRFGFGKEPFA